jgi:hypothetical protein
MSKKIESPPVTSVEGQTPQPPFESDPVNWTDEQKRKFANFRKLAEAIGQEAIDASGSTKQKH